MKRIGGLYDDLWHWDTLCEAWRRARRGAVGSEAARRFGAQLESNLTDLGAELRAERVRLRGFTRFVIHDPKERTITAPHFRDRVLHHAVMIVCEPFFEKWLVGDTYACRRGKGRLAALERATGFAGRFDWFVKMDVRRYFESIPHDRLRTALGRKFKDRRLLALFSQLVGAHEAAPGRGLPIGSLISQHLANFYLDPLDRFAKETLRAPGFVRYMDDFSIWSPERATLRSHWKEIGDFLPGRLGLELKSGSHLNRTGHGMNFCGFRVFPGWRVLNRRSRRRLAARLLELERLWNSGGMAESEIQARAQSVIAFAKEGKSWQVRHRALARASTV